jgi:hypothetical protein
VSGWLRQRAGARSAWGLLVAATACHFLAGNEADNDLWVHLLIGRRILSSGAVPRLDDLSFTAAGAPWVDHEWFAQAAFAAAYEWLGGTGLWLAKSAVGFATVALVWRSTARRSASPWLRGPVMVLAIAVLGRGFAIRPQIVTYAALAVLLLWLERRFDDPPSPWRAAAVVGLAFCLWANAHGGFVVGVAVLALAAVVPTRSSFETAPSTGRGASSGRTAFETAPSTGRGASSGRTENLSWRWAALGAALGAACVNPYGPRLLTYIAHEIFVPHPLTEWQPVSLAAENAPFLLLSLAFVATLPFGREWRSRPWRTLLVLLLMLMAFRHQRHTPLVALAAAAPLAGQLEGLGAWLERRGIPGLSVRARAAVVLGLVGIALVQIGLFSIRLWNDRARIVFAARDYPVGAVAFLGAAGIGGNLALPLDWGGYVLWHASPSVKVSLDGRFATVYPPAVVADNFAFFRAAANAGSTRLLDAYPTSLVLSPAGRSPVEGQSGWSPIYRDQVAALWARGVPRPLTAGRNPSGRIPFP